MQVYNDECMCKPGFNSKFSTNPADKFVFTTFEQFTKLVFKWVWGTEKIDLIVFQSLSTQELHVYITVPLWSYLLI